MRYLALIVALPLAATSLAGCSMGWHDDSTPGIAGSGSGAARSYAAADFDAVELSGSDDVDVRVGTGFSVRAEGPKEELDKLKITKVGNTLRVGRINHSGMSWGHHDSVKVFVTMPRIAKAGLAGSGDMAIDRVEGQDFTGESAGSGSIAIAAINVQSGKFSLAGSGDMTLVGMVKKLSIEIAGSGNVDAGGVKAEGASVSIAGSGNAKADVTGNADISIMGSGDVDMGKGATCTTSKMGSGTVSCGG